MNLTLDIKIPAAPVQIKHGDEIILMGSCFSDSLVPHFNEAGFDVLSNPFGTIFHPLAIARILEEATGQNTSFNALNRNDLWFDWRASSQIYGATEEELNAEIADRFSVLRNRLSSAKLLVITLGTAWGYKRYGKIVANCHKMPASTFEKELSTQSELFSEWNQLLAILKQFNPSLEVLFTVSPVRHAKDGLVENNRSKARLIELVHTLQKKSSYFPSYEIVIDVLRDYRFFKEDLVHPNDQAIKIVWDYFSSFIFDQETIQLSDRVRHVNQMKGHHSLFPGSDDDLKLQTKIESLQEGLQESHPEIYWK